jgi:hypothetical protein
MAKYAALRQDRQEPIARLEQQNLECAVAGNKFDG